MTCTDTNTHIHRCTLVRCLLGATAIVTSDTANASLLPMPARCGGSGGCDAFNVMLQKATAAAKGGIAAGSATAGSAAGSAAISAVHTTTTSAARASTPPTTAATLQVTAAIDVLPHLHNPNANRNRNPLLSGLSWLTQYPQTQTHTHTRTHTHYIYI